MSTSEKEASGKMATITKRNDSYRIRVSLGFDANGKQIQKTCTYKPQSTTPKAIEKEVQQFANDWEKRIREGKFFDGESMTFKEVAEQWFEKYEKNVLSIGQQEKYLRYLETKVYPTIANLKISSIKPIHIQNIVDDMNSKGYSAQYIRRVYVAVCGVFNYAYRLEIIDRNPIDRIKLPPLKKKDELHYFTLEQAKEFLHALDMEYTFTYKEHTSHQRITKKEQSISEYTQVKKVPLQFKVLFNLAIKGGFRIGEILALTWNDIDFESNVIHIRHNTGRSNKGQYIKEPKTITSIRDVKMPQSCFDLLKDWYKEEKHLAHEMGTAWQGKHGKKFNDTFIFIQNDGKQMNIDTPYQRFKTIIKNYNATIEDDDKKLPEIRLHDLRHTSATLLLSENVDIETVSQRLGHSKASITLDVYGHALKKKDEEASDKIEELFD